ncbi:MAG: PIN domain-containing protein [Candidatus Altiarchaeota archaeon]|nr:PIN domain-containing protein [Candidatus Altiarchaeota archaeon]
MRKGKAGLRYFYDTYALVEVLKGNPEYTRFVIEKDGITSRLNLMETYRFLLRSYDKTKAGRIFDSLLPFAVDFEDVDLKEAVLLKVKDSDLSYLDCLGYTLSRRLRLGFLTGDKEFSKYAGVVFVK